MAHEEPGTEMSIYKYIDENNVMFEGEGGVRALSTLCKDVGYDSIEDFFRDNPEAIEKVFDWIGKNHAESVEALVEEEEDEDEDD